MATVETKIKLFEIMVIEKKLNDEREKLNELSRQHKKVMDDAQAECEEKRKKYMKTIEEKIRADRKRMLMQAEVEAKRQILVKRGELLKRIQDDFSKRMEAFSVGERYEAYFLEQFETAAGAFQKDDLLVGVHPKDRDYVDNAYKTLADERVAGGFYLIHKGAVRYDYTFNREIENMRGFFGEAVSTLLQSLEEASRGE
jgi:vacuolar-type H+-ATPase subunit E/Vma4